MSLINTHYGHELLNLAVAGFALLLNIIASGHAILYKRDSRAAISWAGFIWLVPLVGAVMYFVFGINRLRRRATLLRGGLERYRAHPTQSECVPDELHRHLPPHAAHLTAVARVVCQVVSRPLLPGNQIDPLLNGDAAYPAMLEAIRNARQTISLETYIFDRDEAGVEFAEALGDAVRRGVQVRVLVDAAGLRYSVPSILHVLSKHQVPHARFLPSLAPWRVTSLNMRTHRKILVADGRIGFTGGLNIRIGHCVARHPKSPVADMHFRVRGPVVTQMQEAFADDWLFTTGESLRGETWFPKLESAGPILARGIIDGPDEDFEKLRWTILAALSLARESVLVATPYFLPDQAVVSALNLAALRGVKVDILLPEKSNLRVVEWASRAMWWQVLKHGCRLWLTPPPFDHTKLMIVDGSWVLLGSANWDARSLRLNFEYNVECYDADLARGLATMLEKKRAVSHPVTLKEMDARSLPVRLRDGVARLFTPYM